MYIYIYVYNINLLSILLPGLESDGGGLVTMTREVARSGVKNDKHYWNWQIKLYWTENIRLTNKLKHIFNIWYNQKVKNFYSPNETIPLHVYMVRMAIKIIYTAKTKELFNKTNLNFVSYIHILFNYSSKFKSHG